MLSTPDFAAEIRLQIGILDAMFSDPGLARLRTRFPLHPAVLRRDALDVFFPLRPRPYEELLAVATEVGTMAIDRIFWMSDPGAEDYWTFLSDPSAARRVRANLEDPKKFNETIVEVRTWAHLRHHRLSAELIEEDGLPDISINRGRADECWVEVKFVHRSTSNRGILRALQHANAQLRNASGGGAGVVYLYFDRLLAPRRLPATPEEAEASRRSSGEDHAPHDVAGRLALIENALRGLHYKSIGATVIGWDDHGYIGDWPKKVTYFVRRDSRVRRHSTPRKAVVFSDEVLRVGGWMAFGLGVRGQAAKATDYFASVREG